MKRKIWFTTDDFGNQWRFVELQDGTRLWYQAPTRSHADETHDAWGGPPNVPEELA